MIDDEGYVLIIEWDGAKPPTKWYNRLAKLGLSTGNRFGHAEDGVLARRASDAGVTHQEGAIICKARSTARSLGHVAYELGAKAVTVARIEIESLSMTAEDEAALNRISRTLNRRGRPSKDEPTDWVVTCRDEGRTHQLTSHREPAYCPRCASGRVQIHSGIQASLSLPGGALLDVWQKSRFATGAFEIPLVDPEAPAANGSASEAGDTLAIQALAGSLLIGEIAGLDQATQLRLLDLGFINLQLTQDERQTRRIHGITNFIAKGGSPLCFTLPCQINDVSLIDLADQDKALVPGLLPSC